MNHGDPEPDASERPDSPTAGIAAPGGPDARVRGCVCSVLANAAHRVDTERQAVIDPTCPVHATSTTRQ